MKLAAFKERIKSNPWNALEPEKDVNLIKARQQQVENWRKIVYDDIEEAYGKDIAKITDEHFKHGEITYKDIDKKKK